MSFGIPVNYDMRANINSKKGRIRQRKERDGLCLSSAVPNISGTLTPIAPTAIRLWETFTF